MVNKNSPTSTPTSTPTSAPRNKKEWLIPVILTSIFLGVGGLYLWRSSRRRN